MSQTPLKPPQKPLQLASLIAGLPALDDVLREMHRRSFYDFFVYHWPEMEPGSPYIEAQHARVVCDHLQAVYEGVIPELSIEIGPGYGKSLISAVAFPAWIWGARNDPRCRLGFSTYAAPLTKKDSARCRDLIWSDTYQRLYGSRFKLKKTQEDYLTNNKGGYRAALSTGGKATGYRFNIWLGDDLLNMMDAFTPAGQDEMRMHMRAISSRGEIGRPYYRVVIGQRLSEGDAGAYARDNRFTVLCLPTEYDPSRHCITPIFSDWRTERGQLLFPVGFGPEKVAKAKFELGPDYSAQHQQMPIPADGGIIKSEYFHYYDPHEKPSFSFFFASVDTAQGQDVKNDKTAVSIHGVHQQGIALEDGWSGHKPAALVIQMLKDFGHRYNPAAFVIEQKDWGKALTQLLEVDPEFRWPIVKYMPVVSKNMRCHEASPLFFKGQYWMPRGTPLTEQAATQLVVFPASKDRDLADSIIQAAIHAQASYTFGAPGWTYEGASTSNQTDEDDDEWQT